MPPRSTAAVAAATTSAAIFVLMGNVLPVRAGVAGRSYRRSAATYSFCRNFTLNRYAPINATRPLGAGAREGRGVGPGLRDRSVRPGPERGQREDDEPD